MAPCWCLARGLLWLARVNAGPSAARKDDSRGLLAGNSYRIHLADIGDGFEWWLTWFAGHPLSVQKDSCFCLRSAKSKYRNGEHGVARGRRHTREEMVQVLRQIDAGTARGMTTQIACYEAGISEQTYYRWYTEYVNLTIDQAHCLKTLLQSMKRTSEERVVGGRVAERPGAEAP